MSGQGTQAVRVTDLVVGFGDTTVLDGLSFHVPQGTVAAVIGPSGSGKTVAMRTLLGLVPVRGGEIEILGQDPSELGPRSLRAVRRNIGVLFQQGALFSSLTVLENIEVPMREHLDLDARLMRRVALTRLDMAGLPRKAAHLYPYELSGGMIKRAALARALALDPRLLFLDEPTAGLDPIAADAFDRLVGELRAALDLTIVMNTHDLDSLAAICQHVVVIGRGRLLCEGALDSVRAFDDPWIKDYFGGPRARRLGG